MSRTRMIFLSLAMSIVALVAPPSVAQDVYTKTIGFGLCNGYGQGFCSNSGLSTFPLGSGSATGTVSYGPCPITVLLPNNARVIEVTMRVTIQRGTPAGGTPRFTASLNGSQLGQADVVNWGDCNPAEYSFSSGVYPHGVPGFVANGTNTYEFLVENSYGISFVGLAPGGWLDVKYVGGVPRLEISDQTPEIDRRLLLHKYGSHDTYPSQYQRRRVAAGSPDGEMEIVARVFSLDGTSTAGKMVYFRLEDASGGNLGDAPRLIPDRVQVDQNSRATVVLKAQPNTASGNDYRIKASLDVSVQNTGLCGTECSMSGVITTWKRAYLEKHAMFRKGSFIHHVQLPNRVFVHDLAPFQASSGGVLPNVRLIHAPPFASGVRSDFWWTDARVLAVQAQSNQEWAGYIEIDKSIDPAKSYDRDQGHPEVVQLSDFAGVITTQGARTPGDYFDVGYGLVSNLFQGARVEYVPGPPQVIGPDPATSDFPYVAKTWRGASWTLAMKWQQSAQRSSGGRIPLANHKVVVGFSREDESDRSNWTFGTNNPGTLVTMINRARIEEAFARLNGFKTNDTGERTRRANAMARETVAHELTHNWRVNLPSNPAFGGHCDGNATNSSLFCLLNEERKQARSASQCWDDILGWHTTASTPGENDGVRTFDEPMTQDSPTVSFVF